MTDNATFYTFKPSGKWYECSRGVCPPGAFNPMLSHAERRNPILVANGGKMPGLSGPGEDLIVVVALDESADFGWPLMLPVR